MKQNETRYPIGFSHMIARCPALSNLDNSYSYPYVRIEKRWFKETRNRLQMFECDSKINDADKLAEIGQLGQFIFLSLCTNWETLV